MEVGNEIEDGANMKPKVKKGESGWAKHQTFLFCVYIRL